MLLGAAAVAGARPKSFVASAFTIKRQVGQLGFFTETEWEYKDGNRNPLDPNSPPRTLQASGISVRLFDATLPDGQRVLLKEFLPEANQIGENEMKIANDLENSVTPAKLPLCMPRLLGYMRADSAFDSASLVLQWRKMMPDTPAPQSGNLWLVFTWAGLRTLAGFPRVTQERSWFDFSGEISQKQRRDFVRCAASKSLQALAAIHSRGVAHRSLSGSSLILSTYDQRMSSTLEVGLIDFGFAVNSQNLGASEIASAMRRGAPSPLDVVPIFALEDLHGLGYTLLQLVLETFSERDGDEFRPVDLQTLKRLIEDVFKEDVKVGFREYCSAESDWSSAVDMLDEGDGWELLHTMIGCHNNPGAIGKVNAHTLLASSTWLRL